MGRYGKLTGAAGECLWFGKVTSAQQIVEDLVIEDGVPSRGHRLCIYEPGYAVAAAQMGVHSVFGQMVAILFVSASGYESAGAQAIAPRKAAGPSTLAATDNSAQGRTQWEGVLGNCRGCREPIKGGSVIETKMLGKFHKACFKCTGCATPLVGVPYKTTPDVPDSKKRLFCENCHVSRFAPICAGCGEKMVGGGLIIGGAKYHRECKPIRESSRTGTTSTSAGPKAKKKVVAAPSSSKGGSGGAASSAKKAASRAPQKAAKMLSKGGLPALMDDSSNL